jgi:hypothetical protein
MRASHAQVTVDFELDSEPIAGSLQHADRTTTFNGWIELVAMLQKAATSPARHAPAADPASNGATRTRQPLDAAIVLPAPRPTIGIVAIRRSADVRRTFAKSRATGEYGVSWIACREPCLRAGAGICRPGVRVAPYVRQRSPLRGMVRRNRGSSGPEGATLAPSVAAAGLTPCGYVMHPSPIEHMKL